MRTSFFSVLGFFASFGLTLAVSAQQSSTSIPPTPPTGAPWSYYGHTGPSNWGRLDPAYSACAKGKLQSPIDIRNPKLNKALPPIEFHYVSGPVNLVNTGHTIRVNVTPGGYIVVGGARYELIEFHFHHPAEDLVNGKLSDMVIDLVHKNAAGELAIIAVRLNEGQDNGALAALWPSLPKTAGATTSIDATFNPLGLLPSDRSYWSYVGSITVPPCTEGVHWLSMQNPADISQDQLQTFGRLYPDNAHPLQATHGRKIEASQ
ncbi:Carbonic anhydrase [Acidisarcina polymorpha]|uniref:carbonic anhydrase n=1 Tax=Acidisarcina polymorpha TaxID=2211140 RepID=A0A2Z5G2A4_9BACT|nr:carbonic anhydrase family protein [Acidisarcina polymorpha]AXC13222.1 Carbonic anhydrase [Acidisarcina polymorpha]